jgi:hypothetical protein
LRGPCCCMPECPRPGDESSVDLLQQVLRRLRISCRGSAEFGTPIPRRRPRSSAALVSSTLGSRPTRGAQVRATPLPHLAARTSSLYFSDSGRTSSATYGRHGYIRAGTRGHVFGKTLYEPANGSEPRGLEFRPPSLHWLAMRNLRAASPLLQQKQS